MNIQAIDLVEIGSGGGSIARARLGVIAVGPESASSVPGPVCYGRGGVEPTVTDANVVLGYINPDYFAGGSVKLEPAAATRAIETKVAAPLGLSLEDAAWGIHAIVTTNMELATRVVSIERGRAGPGARDVRRGLRRPLRLCEPARARGGRHVEALGGRRLAPHRAREGADRGPWPRGEGEPSRLLSRGARLCGHTGLRPLRARGRGAPHGAGDRGGARVHGRPSARPLGGCGRVRESPGGVGMTG